MSRHPFDPSLEDLPQEIPIFPLTGAVILPGGYIPLNVFEPRYINMVLDAMRTPTRLIGVIQPRANPEEQAGRMDGVEPVANETPSQQKATQTRDAMTDPDEQLHHPPALYDIGCAGRISAFSEEEDGRILMRLTGVCRFRVEQELPQLHGYRRVLPAWQEFVGDLEGDKEAQGLINRDRLLPTLREYFRMQSIDANWDSIRDTGDEPLITTLCLISPLEPQEKQALLEAPTLIDRAKILQTLIEMAVLSDNISGSTPN
jgi:Lon protease-like protein